MWDKDTINRIIEDRWTEEIVPVTDEEVEAIEAEARLNPMPVDPERDKRMFEQLMAKIRAFKRKLN